MDESALFKSLPVTPVVDPEIDQKKIREIQREKRKRLKEENERVYAEERRKAALGEMRYMLSVCEEYSDIYRIALTDKKTLENKNNFVPSLADIEGAKKQGSVKKTLKDCDVTNLINLFEGGTLHPYQLEGVTWLNMLNCNSMNGILADEMGLGKTVQVIALICVLLIRKILGPFLIVAPLSTIPNWESEFKRFAPKIPVVVITGSADDRKGKIKQMYKKKKVGDVETYPVVLVTYQTPLLEYSALDKFKWKYIIVDEGHRIKNHESSLSIRLRQLRSENRLLLTGTPLQNNIVELWALLNFLLPNFFSNMNAFTELILMEDLKDENKLIQQEESNNLVTKIHNVLAPFMLRRLKAEVLTKMVPKKEVTVFCPMSPLQMKLYDWVIDRNIGALRNQDADELRLDGPKPKRKCTMRKKDYTFKGLDAYMEKRMRVDVGEDEDGDDEIDGLVLDRNDLNAGAGEAKNFTTAIRLTMRSPMMMFRKIVNHPYLVHFPLDPNSEKRQLLIDEELIKSSGKLMVLDKMLPKLKYRGHKILLFSQLTMGLDLIEEYLILRNYNYRRLDGGNKLEERAQSMREFNTDPNVFIFLISTRAGGLGLNLTGADTVIFYDRDWNPQMDIQAQDRCHRIGQTKPVVIYTLTAKNTVDDHIINTAKMKRVLEKVVISDGKFKKLAHDETANAEQFLVELRKALKKDEDHVSYIFSNSMELNRLLDRSDLYEAMEKTEKEDVKKKRVKKVKSIVEE